MGNNLENYTNYFFEKKIMGRKYLNVAIEDSLGRNQEAIIIIYFLDEKNNRIMEKKIQKSQKVVKINERNIVIPTGTSEIKIIGIGHVDINYHLTKRKLYSTKQMEYFKKHDLLKVIKGRTKITYSLKIKGVKKLVVNFPDLSPTPFDEAPYQLGLENDLEGVALLSFIDNYDSRGTSFLAKDEVVMQKISQIIKKKSAELEIQETDVLFYGCDKGANIASCFSHYFPQASYIYVAPILNIAEFQKKNKFRSIENHIVSFSPNLKESVKQTIVMGRTKQAVILEELNTLYLNESGLINLRSRGKLFLAECLNLFSKTKTKGEKSTSPLFLKNHKLMQEVRESFLSEEMELTLFGIMEYSDFIEEGAPSALLPMNQLMKEIIRNDC